MSGLFPEQPILFYPSLARRYGTEEALLLAVYHEFARHHGMVDGDGVAYFLARRIEWQSLISFWEEDRLAEITSSLVSQGAIDAQFNANGSIRVALTGLRQPPSSASAVSDSPPAQAQPTLKPESGAEAERAPAIEPTIEPTVEPAATRASARSSTPYQRLRSTPPSVAASVAPCAATAGPSVSMLHRGPAPSFGGSVGWSRPKDDLEQLFDQQEQRNQRLHEISHDWRPSDTTYQMLAKHNISADFADDLVDEFISYWSARDKKEVSWDPLFIRLAKKQWVKEQTRQGRDQKAGWRPGEPAGNGGERNSVEVSGERYQPNNRAEKRERITEAVMDIKNLDWI